MAKIYMVITNDICLPLLELNLLLAAFSFCVLPTTRHVNLAIKHIRMDSPSNTPERSNSRKFGQKTARTKKKGKKAEAKCWFYGFCSSAAIEHQFIIDKLYYIVVQTLGFLVVKPCT